MFPQDREYYFPNIADSELARAASFLIKYRIVPAQYIDRVDLDAAMPREELYAFLMSWIRRHEAVAEATGRIASVSGNQMALRVDGKPATFTLPSGIPMFRKLLDRAQEYKSVPWMIGDRATVLRRGSGAPLAVIVLANYDGAAFDRISSFSSWVRTFRADELVTTISKRNPIRELADLRPTRIDNAHRVAEMDVVAENGRIVHLAGLPVRWSLGIPDNLFTFEKSKDPDGMDRYTFFGKGWGHGVGMCQSGAQGMAMRGYKAEEIVKHYYTGIEIVPVTSLPGMR
jgi:stage II sporulation protein D